MLRNFSRYFKFSKSKDLYSVLDIPKTSTPSEIKKQYLKLAKQYHPDYSPSTADKFKEINAAYQVLGDEAKRREYDNGFKTTQRSSQQYTNNPQYTRDPFRNTGFYYTQRQNSQTHYDEQQRNADMFREYFRQRSKAQEEFWKQYQQQMKRHQDNKQQIPTNPTKGFWILIGFSLLFSIYMTSFTMRGQSHPNQGYVKVVDPMTSKIIIMSRGEFQKNQAYQQVVDRMGQRERWN